MTSNNKDQYGFADDTFDEDNQTAIINLKLMRQINSKIPEDWASNWYYYRDSIISFGIYAAIFGTSYYFQIYTPPKLQTNITLPSEKQIPSEYVFSPLWGFGYIGLFGCGHEALHKCFVPPRAKFGKAINKFISFITMDCLVNSAIAWSKTHVIDHHKTVNQWPPDEQHLFGSTMIEEYFW